MSGLRRLRTSVWFVLRQMRASAGLSVATIVAMAALIGVWVGIPLYAESASARLLSAEVDEAASEGVPFGYLFSYNRLSGGNKTWQDLAPLNALVQGEGNPFGSEVREHRRTFTTVPFDLLNEGETIGAPAFVSVTNFAASADIVQGRAPAAASTADEQIEVAIDQDFATAAGLSAGQTLTVLNRRLPLDDPERAFQVTVTGVWEPPAASVRTSTPEDRFLTTGTLTGNLVVPEATLQNTIEPMVDGSLSNAQWLVLLDSSSVTTDSVATLLDRTGQINRQVDELVRGARILVTPERSLDGFQAQVASLNRGLTLFSIPILFLLLAVLGAVVWMRWTQRRPQVTMLRQRGVRAHRVLAQAVIESLLLATGAAVVGLVAARATAGLIGRTETFLLFGDGVDLALVMNSRSWTALVVSGCVAALVSVIPSLTTLRREDLGTRRGDGGAIRPPWFQRTYLDIVTVVGVAFFSWILLRRGNLLGELLDDPLVILLPAASAVGAGFIVLRLYPLLLRGLARVADRVNSTALLLVSQRGSRVRGAVAAPLLMLVITGALAIYTGSLARTLDLQLHDAAHHQVGAVSGVVSDPAAGLGSRFEISNGVPRQVDPGGALIDAASVGRVWGLSSASRLATLPARVQPVGQSSTAVTFTAVDTESFADVAFWRSDYGDESLATLMALLDATDDGVLVSSQAAVATGLRVGDTVEVSVRDSQIAVAADMVVVGTFDQFPMWIPGDGPPPIVGSLSDLEARAGRDVGRQLLFETDEDLVDPVQTQADLSRIGIGAELPRSAADLVDRAQRRPERQGVFGLLTVSFVLALAMTLAAFALYAIFGFTRQRTEIGVLRALGMRGRTLLILVGADLFLVGAVGVGAAAATGLAMSRWYLPRLVQNPGGVAPELLPEIDWTTALGVSVALAIALALATIGLLLGLRQLKLFEAIKVGATP